MPRLLYEYLYVNMWILLFLALMWANDGYISFGEGCILIVLSISGITFVGKKQVRLRGSYRFRK